MKLLSDIKLTTGAHSDPESGMCAMEAVAWYMDEKHTDHPQCVSPTIAAAMRVFNDWLPQGKRDAILKPLLLEVIGTNTTLDDEITRAKISADYAKQFADIAAKSAEYAEYAESAEYAAKSAEYAAKSAAKSAAKYAEYAAKSAAESAESAESAADYEVLIGQYIMDMCKVGK